MRYLEFCRLNETELSYRDDIKWNLLSSEMFRGPVGETVKSQIDREVRRRFHFEGDIANVDEADYETLLQQVRTIQRYMYQLHRYGYDRRRDLTDWFELAKLNFVQLLQTAHEKVEPINWSDDDDEEQEEDEVDDNSRFVPYSPEMENWHYIRFGPIPKLGGSHCGLAADDNEDGPDEWRVALGGMTRESGISVFHAIRSHSDPQGWQIFMPQFERARYGVPNDSAYLKSIIPANSVAKWRKDPSMPFALLLHGSPVMTKVRGSKNPYTELGSDGEYLIDPKKPLKVTNVGFDHIYISDKAKLVDLYPQQSDQDEDEWD